MLPYMTSVGAAEDISFSFGGLTAATTDAHRLTEWAFAVGGFQAQGAVMEALFRSYFERQENIGDAAVLAAAAGAAGLDAAAAAAYLASGDGREHVTKDARAWAMRYRVTGVPFFVVNGKYRLSGAQEPGAFADVFAELSEEAAAAREAAGPAGGGGGIGSGGVGGVIGGGGGGSGGAGGGGGGGSAAAAAAGCDGQACPAHVAPP
jgi:predicted DsbA family dithiol-disulfide isomerase